jgi:predicted phage tail protein
MSIFGAGGGGGKAGGAGRKAKEAKDNLDSTSYAKIVELLSEGEIEGFATPSKLGLTQGTTAYMNASMKDMYFNKTPLLRSGASNTAPQESDFNFSNVTIATRFGTQAQAYVPGFDAVENEVSVGSDVLEGVPITRTITDSDVDAVRITINVPLLQEFKANGDVLGSEFQLAIAVQYNGGGFVTVINDAIKGRTSDLYQRDYVVNLDTINGIITGTYSQTDTTVTVTTVTPHNLSVGAAFYSNILSGTAISGTNVVTSVNSLTSFSYTTSASLTTSGDIELNDLFPVDIRVTRVSPDSTSVKISNAFSWSTYTELIYEKLRYPNSAYIALRIDAEQFNSIPSRSYKIRGIKVRIPNNATVDATTGRLTYAGVWNGTFGAAAWTTDPAWILWDLLTSSRYGLGDHIQAATLDRWAFFRASQFCNELVPTGLNSPTTEPRFSCNVNIQTQEEAYKVINDMCSVFRAMPFWSIGSLTVAQDRPSDPVALFSLSNVAENGFNYEGSSIKTRATVVVVSWLNLELGDIDREIVEDADGIAKYGVITKEVSAFATTSRGQAHRIGEWLLYTERYETEVVTFVTGLENGVVLRPGSVIEIADPVKAGARRGGRISAATTSVITVDDGTGLPISGTLSVVLPDAVVAVSTITGVTGNNITVSPAFDTAPAAGSVWLVEDSTIQPTQWRVVSVQEQDGMNFAVNAVSYNSSKYAYVERGAALEARTISILNVPPDTPIDLAGEELLYALNGRVASKLSLSWRPVRGVNEYRIRWRGEFDNWKETKSYGPIYEIEDVTAGLYNIEVYSISASQVVSSAPAELSFTVQGVGAPPADPTGVSLVPINESTAIIQWDLATDLDVLVGGEVLIRHDPRDMPTAEWSTSNAIVQAAAGSQTQKQVPLLAGTYFIAFRDQSGVRSLNPVGIQAVLPTPQPRLTVKTWAEQNETPPFNGLNTDLPYDNVQMGLYLDPSISTTGSYLYEDTLNLRQIYDVNIQRRLVGFPVASGSILFDSVAGLFDAQPGNFDGDNLDTTNATTYVRTTTETVADVLLLENGDALVYEDNGLIVLSVINTLLLENDDILLLEEGGAFVCEDPEFGPWNEYANAIVRAKAVQLKVEAATTSSLVGMVIDDLGATAELQQRSESGSGTGSSTYNVTFTSAFYQTPEVGITPSDMATGDYFTVTSVTRTGFTVAFKNSANAAVTRSYVYTAIGYGKEV